MADNKKKILDLVEMWLDSANQPGSNDEELVIERRGNTKDDATKSLTGTRFIVHTKLHVATADIEFDVLAKLPEKKLIV